MEITRISGASTEEVQNALTEKLVGLGFDFTILPRTSTSFEIRDIRIAPERLQSEGYNYRMFPYAAGFSKHPRRTRALTWDNWIEVNGSVNEVLDRMNVSANVKTLGGKFKIREGTHAYTAQDWSELGRENVGSQVSPITRRSAILHESELEGRGVTPSKFKGKWSQPKLPSQNPSGWHNEPINHALASKGIKVGKSRAKR